MSEILGPTGERVSKTVDPSKVDPSQVAPDASGRENLGRADQINPNSLASSQAKQASIEEPVSWLNVTKEGEEEMWQPVFSIPGIGKHYLKPRTSKHITNAERRFTVLVLANNIAEYLFGRTMFTILEYEDDNGEIQKALEPNPDFDHGEHTDATFAEVEKKAAAII